jgi:hypothetical protein
MEEDAGAVVRPIAEEEWRGTASSSGDQWTQAEPKFGVDMGKLKGQIFGRAGSRRAKEAAVGGVLIYVECPTL